MNENHTTQHVRFDIERQARIGLAEAIMGDVKSPAQISEALRQIHYVDGKALITRLTEEKFHGLPEQDQKRLDYDPISKTAMSQGIENTVGKVEVVIVTGGTADVGVAREAARTLAYHGVPSRELVDVGVAGLWRLMEHKELVQSASILIVCAGMEGALFSVVGGLARGVIIAVATSNGYGVAEGGRVALNAALSSCAPGIAATNIDNGYGAACLAIRILSIK
jgi:NCAIR mutase (PurE)-related protein